MSYADLFFRWQIPVLTVIWLGLVIAHAFHYDAPAWVFSVLCGYLLGREWAVRMAGR